MLIKLLRLKQWIKNLFILLPVVFSGRFIETPVLITVFWVFFSFSLLTSAFYILNDVRDRESDRYHPLKSKRPVASGKITIPAALVISGLCFLSGTAGLWLVAEDVLLLAFAYALLQMIYNWVTRNHVILDVLTIAAGFQIRIWLGSLAVGVLPSLWLQLCVFVLALFLGFTKRRHEIMTLREKANDHRTILSHYTVYFLDQMILISSALCIVFYSLYAISPDVTSRVGGGELFYSTVFVIYAIFRYLYLVTVKRLGDDPGEVILSDKPILLCLFLWGSYIIWDMLIHLQLP